MRVTSPSVLHEDCSGDCYNCGTEVKFYSSELKVYSGHIAAGSDNRYWECPTCTHRNYKWEWAKREGT